MNDKPPGLLAHIRLALMWLTFNAAFFSTALWENWPTYVLFMGAGLSVVFGLALILGDRELRRASDRRHS